MPTYEYACTECGEQLEVVQSFTDDALTVCPACKGKLRKVFSPVGVVFKGSGFYKTDSRAGRSNGNKSTTAGESGSSSESAGEKSSSTSTSDSSSSNDSASKSSSDSKPSSDAGSTSERSRSSAKSKRSEPKNGPSKVA